MSLRTLWVPYGPPAVEGLRREIEATKAGDPLQPVTVIVPSNHVGVSTRRQLASGRVGPVCGVGAGMAAVGFLTVYRLAELVGAARLAGSGRRPVSSPVIAAAVRGVLDDEPGLFGPVADHPSTEEALVDAYRELRDLTGEALADVAAVGVRANEVVRVQRQTRARLEVGWYDEQDLMTAAAELLSSGPTSADLGRVVVYLPQRMSRHGVALLRAVAVRHEVVVVAGATGDLEADREVARSVKALDPADGGPPAVAPHELVDADRTCFVTTSDAEEEARNAVRAVVDAARDGVPLGRMAILHASPVPYARLLHEQLAAAGTTANGAAVVTLAQRTAGRVLLRLLDWPEVGYSRSELFAWLAASPVRDVGRALRSGSWERLSRDAAVVAGREDWDRRLTDLADRLDAAAADVAEDVEQPAWKADRLRRDAEGARDLRRFVLGLIDELEAAAAAPRPWPEHARWARDLQARLLGGPAAQQDWDRDEQRAAERVDAALDRLGSIGDVEGPVALAVFARTLRLVLDADLGRTGRLGEGVLVGSVAMGVGLDLDLAVVVGMAEGTFPGIAAEDALLGDLERAAAGGQLSTRRDQVDEQHRQLLAALAGAGRQVISIPRGDLRRSADRVPSRWALDLASAVAGERWWPDDLLAADRPWVDHVDSFEVGVQRSPSPATGQEYRLRALIRSGWDAVDGEDRPDPRRIRAGAVVAARRSDRFTRFDGRLHPGVVPSPRAALTSTTQLEQWAACPFAYLLRYALDVDVIEDPETRLQISPLDRGNLVHAAMEAFIREVLDRPPAEQPGPDTAWSSDDHARLAVIAGDLCDGYEQRGLTGRRIFWNRDRAAILRDLHRVLTLDDDQRRGERTHPIAAELAFGLRTSTIPAVAMPLPDGDHVAIRGKADRVDEAEDGSLHVVDYKTGSTTAYKGLQAGDPVAGGTKLQLPVYAQAARLATGRPDADVRAEYWFVSAKGAFVRIGYPLTAEISQRASSVLGSIVDGIDAGVFAHHPSANTTNPWVECPYCDPDALGAIELRRSWERKRADSALAPYATLVEPDADVAQP